MKSQEIIDQARKRFDSELHTDDYQRIHADDEHLNLLMGMLEIQPEKKYMDLGTGNGYLAFEMARRYPNIQISGVDITREAIRQNQRLQREGGIDNLEFMTYDGHKFPMEDGAYRGIISRYAFHHFPDPVNSIREMHRVLENQGFVIISDPQTYNEDAGDFVDQFQKLKQDGHVHFYRQKELDDVFRRGGFIKEQQYQSECTYPRDLDSRYEQLIMKTPKEILEKYQIVVEATDVFITVAVMNSIYRKV
jgi:ubiquinone/menaquinone biosynthesis C-methylase UbiE